MNHQRRLRRHLRRQGAVTFEGLIAMVPILISMFGIVGFGEINRERTRVASEVREEAHDFTDAHCEEVPEEFGGGDPPGEEDETDPEEQTRYRETAADGTAALAGGIVGFINTVVGWCHVIYEFIPFLGVYFPETDLSPVVLTEAIATAVSGPVQWIGGLAGNYGDSLREERAAAAAPSRPNTSSGGYVNIEHGIDRTCAEKSENVAPGKGRIARRIAAWARGRVTSYMKLKYAAIVALLWGATAKQLDTIRKVLIGTIIVDTVVLSILQCFNFDATGSMAFFEDVYSRCQVGFTSFFMSIFWG